MTTLTLDPVVAALAVRGVVWAVPWDPGMLFAHEEPLIRWVRGELPQGLAGLEVQIRADDTVPKSGFYSDYLVANRKIGPKRVPMTEGDDLLVDQVVGSATVTEVLPITTLIPDCPPGQNHIIVGFGGLWVCRNETDGPGADISDHLALFPEGSWTPGGQECEACEGGGRVPEPHQRPHEKDVGLAGVITCQTCNGSGRTPQRWALILSDPREETDHD